MTAYSDSVASALLGWHQPVQGVRRRRRRRVLAELTAQIGDVAAFSTALAGPRRGTAEHPRIQALIAQLETLGATHG